MATAKLFMHGRSQAVRLPKHFRMPGSEVEVLRIGDSVVLKPLARTAEAMPWAAIDALGDGLFMQGGREQPEMPDDTGIFDA